VTQRGASTSGAGVRWKRVAFGVDGEDVQPILEWSWRSCRAVQAVGSLTSGLALTPGSDPGFASSSLRGASSWRSGHPVVARGGPRRGIGDGPVRHARLTEHKRLAGPSVLCAATPHPAFDLAPRSLLHAEQRSPARVAPSTPLAPVHGSPYTTETGSHLAIGTTLLVYADRRRISP